MSETAVGVDEPNIKGWLPDPPDHRDFKLADHHPEILRMADPVALPAYLNDILQYLLAIENQLSLGGCTAYGSESAFEAVMRKMGIPVVKGSKLAQYYWSRLIQGWQNQDSGAYIRDAIKVLVNTGMARDELWPYDISKFTQAPPTTVMADAGQRKAVKYISVPNDTTQLKAVLVSGYPVVIGFSVPQNFPMQSTTGMIPMPSGNIIGGHCVLLIGYDDSKQCWIFRNSWGTGWGDQGYGYMPYEFLRLLGSDFWMISEVSGAPKPPTPPTPPAPVTATVSSVTTTIAFTDGSAVQRKWP